MKSNPRNHNTGRAAWELKLAGSERPFCSQGKVQRRAAPHSGRSRCQQCMPTKAREPLESPVGMGGDPGRRPWKRRKTKARSSGSVWTGGIT